MTGGLSRLALEAANRVDPERVIGLTRDLVRVRSVVDTEAGTTEAEAAALVAAILTDSGFQPLIEEVAPDRPNIICDWSGTDFDPLRDRTLMFEGHTDVVTEGDSALWTRPPFAADLVEGCVYGRGSADMKGGVAAAITALEAIRAVAPDLRGRIRLGFVVDEEGLMLGIKHFIARGWADEVDGAIVCEPEENEICLFQKGAMRVGVRFAGVMSHGAMPYAGVNPITALADFVGRTESFQRQEQERLGPHAQLGLPWFTPTVVRAPPGGGGAAQCDARPCRPLPGHSHHTRPGPRRHPRGPAGDRWGGRAPLAGAVGLSRLLRIAPLDRDVCRRPAGEGDRACLSRDLGNGSPIWRGARRNRRNLPERYSWSPSRDHRTRRPDHPAPVRRVCAYRRVGRGGAPLRCQCNLVPWLWVCRLWTRRPR
ncbi:MAG: M20/M25/M40 family metallo-hydrolase [Truepera sp.]|nr:M20/M25/M40 family metallo-hydrolase [Truepera sp.]